MLLMRRTLLVLIAACLLAPEHPRTVPMPGRYIAPQGEPAPDPQLEALARSAPLEFLKEALARYDRDVQGYEATLIKEERVNGRLAQEETIIVWFKEKPFSVRMDWLKGWGLASRTLYVEGENKGMMLAKLVGPLSFGGLAPRDPEGAEAKSAARYPITKFGIKEGMLSTQLYWRKAHEKGELRVVCDGIVACKELGGRKCLKLRRLEYARPEVDGISRSEFWFDPSNGLQLGSLLRGKDGRLIGRYFFKDLRVNPDFAPDTFTAAGLKK